MSQTFKFLSSLIDYQLKHLVAGTKVTQQTHSLISTKIKNKNLAKEMETACKNNGFLTYAEFLQIVQFGKYGYYATHKNHGMTDTYLRWGKPLALLCKQNKYNTVIEFGCGDGKLGVEILKYAKAIHYPLFWSGVDISKSLLATAKQNFIKENLQKNVSQLTNSIKNLTIKNPCLIVFSYSLDSIAPEIFTTTYCHPGKPKAHPGSLSDSGLDQNDKGLPNALIGVTIKNGTLTEIVLSPKQLRKKGMIFKNGIFTYKKTTYNLCSWKLDSLQRAYIPIESFSILKEWTHVLPKQSTIVILDEFQPSPISWSNSHLGVPKDLDKIGMNRDNKDIKKGYEHSGNDLLYFAFYLKSYAAVLKSLGFDITSTDGEYQTARKLAGEKENSIYKNQLCFTIVAKHTKPLKSPIVILSPM